MKRQKELSKETSNQIRFLPKAGRAFTFFSRSEIEKFPISPQQNEFQDRQQEQGHIPAGKSRFRSANPQSSRKLLPFLALQDSDVHITIDDQMKINKFANFNAKVEDLKEELKVRQNELKNLEEAGDEIELMDEDTIPFLIGEVFVSHDLPRTQVSFLLCGGVGRLVTVYGISFILSIL